MKPNPVQQLMVDLGAGRVSIAEAVDRLPGLLKPMRYRHVPKAEILAAIADDYDGDHLYTPESWDDVSRAYVAYQIITTEQYRALRAVTIPKAIDPES